MTKEQCSGCKWLVGAFCDRYLVDIVRVPNCIGKDVKDVKK